MVNEVTDLTFRQEVAENAKPCVILFTAGWCTWCEEMLARVGEVSEAMGDEVDFFTADSDKQKGMRIEFAVGALPYMVMVRDGMKLPLFDQIVRADQLEERIRYILDGGKPPLAVPLKPLRV